MRKYKVIGGILIVGVVATNVGIMVYLDLPRHIKALAAEEEEHPDQPRKSIHQMISLAMERAFDEKFGPV